MYSRYARRLLRETVPNTVRNRMAKPRGGRRPGAHQARPLTPQASPLSQSFPAPSWGMNNSTASASMQPLSDGLTFGQQSSSFPSSSNSAGSNSSFPSFGGQNNNSNQQLVAQSSTGFNFAAQVPSGNNPFASSNQASHPPAISSGFSGSIFSFPPQTPTAPKSPPKNPAREMRTPSHWRTDLPEAYKEKDPQSFFVPGAPFVWGQTDPPQQEPPQQVVSETKTNVTEQPNAQSSSNTIFSQFGEQKQPASNIFAQLQQPSSSSPNPFVQQPAQQSQTSNIFGQNSASPFNSQPSQPTSSFFGQASTSQNPASIGIFGKPATSPTKDGDSMSTTPDTSPQASNDRARLGPFASTNIPSKETLTNGAAPSGSGSSIFGALAQASSDQGANLTNGEATEATASSEGLQGKSEQATNVSLGSPTKKNRSIAQPKSDPPHTEVQATVKKNPLASITLPAPNVSNPYSPFPFSPSPAPGQNPSSASPQVNGSTLSLFAKPATESTQAQPSQVSRQTGMPPQIPEHFTEEQKRQFITGWRLKSLDQGLQIYLQYSTFDSEETGSIKRFYELRKKAILEANGGPLPELGNKRAAEGEQPRPGLRSKRARHEPPSNAAEQSNRFSNPFPAGKSSPGKRKANEDLHESVNDNSMNSLERSKGDDQVVYPPLPSTTSISQTSKLFGNLVGKRGTEDSSAKNDPAVNGHSSTELAPSNDVQSSKSSSSQSGLFSSFPTSSTRASESSSSTNSDKQISLFNFGKQPASALLQSKSEKPSGLSQPPSKQTGTPFKGFVPDPPKPGNNSAPFGGFFQSQTSTAGGASSTVAQGFGTAQASTNSSVFSGLSRGFHNKTSAKRKADESGEEEVDADGSGPQRSSAEQPNKKQRAGVELTGASDSDKENNRMFKPSATTERPGFGESILTRPSPPPTKSSNIFGHLAKPATQDDHDDENPDSPDHEVDEDIAENEKETEQKNAPGIASQTPNVPASTSSAPSIFNPFANATFPAQAKQQQTEGEKPAGRSLFDRIQQDDKGQPVKDPKAVNFGNSILKTPAGQKTGSFFDQAKTSGNNPFGTPNSTLGSSIFASKSPFAPNETPAAAPASNIFGKSSSPNIAPVANMFSSKKTGDSPNGDNTWKPETPIKFSNTSNSSAPAINFTAPSPAKTSLTGLFGVSKPSTSSESSSPFNFKLGDSTPAKPAPLTFGISAPVKESNDSLAPPSGTQSESTSRATSPGGTDTEGNNEPSDDPRGEESTTQLDSVEAAKAEADEDVVFDAKAKLYQFDTSGPKPSWVLKGTDQFRVLKHRETNKTRMLMRLKNGRIILNAGLQKNLGYVHAAMKKVKFPVATNGKIESWMVVVGKDADAEKLAEVLEENKVY